jgi:hypothetical protein
MIKSENSRNETFTEVDFFQIPKYGQRVCGDAFFSEKFPGKRVISILADGLGSGIKACVLATLTASMAARFIEDDMDIQKAASIIMKTLPICAVRKIGYSTFTIIDVRQDRKVRIIESGNPGCMLFRKGRLVDLPWAAFEVELASDDIPGVPLAQPALVKYREFDLQTEDRLFAFTDGVTQAGMGRKECPLGWGQDAAADFISSIINDPDNPGKAEISARSISRIIAEKARTMDFNKNKDDITCCSVYFREPRKTIVFTGPPFLSDMDCELAAAALDFKGKKIICGGTTANILSRELGRPVEMDISSITGTSPPLSRMKGFDLITEGTITLGKLSCCLENEAAKQGGVNQKADKAEFNAPLVSAVSKLAEHLITSDYIKFIVGTRINQAHQDPSLPEELDIRRNIIKKISSQLKKYFLKEVSIEFI